MACYSRGTRIAMAILERVTRYSADEKDAGYAAYKALGSRQEKLAVYLNGKKVNWCITGDSILGEVHYYVKDNASVSGWYTMTAKGKVEFKFDA